MRIGVLVGTRPEIIKMSPVIDKLNNYYIINTQQHYDRNMSVNFFEQLEIKPPDYNLGVGSGTRFEQISETARGVENVIKREQTDCLLVQGDTNSTLGGALGAFRSTDVGHIEAGLRSFDYRMPEEVNRVLTDQISDLLFAPTHEAETRLGKRHSNVFLTGNTVIDAVKSIELEPSDHDDFILATFHRPENVDNEQRLKQILERLERISQKKKVLFPVHPRTREKMKEFSLSPNIRTMNPLGYLDFLSLINDSYFIITDSGGIIEEAISLKTPTLMVRRSSERREAIRKGGSILTSPGSFYGEALQLINNRQHYKQMAQADNPFGDGTASEKIVKILRDY